MSPVTRQRRDGSVKPARYGSVQPGVVAWLTLVWVVLWGELSVWNVLTGALAGAVVCLVFPLPPLRMHLRVRPLHLIWLIVRFHYDVAAASVQVVLVTLRPRMKLTNAIVAVRLRTPSDFVLTVVGEMVSLIPGSIIVEAQRSTHTLFLHVLDVDDEAAVERFRTRVLEQERRLVRALGADTAHLDLPVEQAQAYAIERATAPKGGAS